MSKRESLFCALKALTAKTEYTPFFYQQRLGFKRLKLPSAC